MKEHHVYGDFEYEYINFGEYNRTGNLDDIHLGFGPELTTGATHPPSSAAVLGEEEK